MLQNKICAILLLFTISLFAQTTRIDTIYVYEEIIIHDTIYVEKPIEKIKIEQTILSQDEKTRKPVLQIIQNKQTHTIPIDSIDSKIAIHFKEPSKPNNSNWVFGIKTGIILNQNSIFKLSDNQNKTYGMNAAFFGRKRIFKNIYIGTSLEGYYIDAFLKYNNLNNSTISGYYFDSYRFPYLFQSIRYKHFQLQIPIQLYYKIKKFFPSVGIIVNRSVYKAMFLGTSGNLPLQFDEKQSYKGTSIQIGYKIELQYQWNKKWSIGLYMDKSNSKNIFFVNESTSNKSFNAALNIEEIKAGVFIGYSF